MNARPRPPIRIGNCSGFYGDRMSALAEIVSSGEVDVVSGDYLAEVTMLVLAKGRMRDPDAGYAASFLPQLRPVVTAIAEQGIKVVVNAGGLNPGALAAATRALCASAGADLVVAHVEGDDVLDRIGELAEAGVPLSHLTTDAPLAEWGHTPLTANAYLGGWGITEALRRGADLVICPRVTDASLVTGPAAWWHDWDLDAFDELAGAVVAGHVIECGTQATGGNFSGFVRGPALDRPGFPIAHVMSDGSSHITKAEGSGGYVTVDTVTAQLLYEIQGRDYLNPDVTTRLDTAQLRQVGADVVEITGTRGAPPIPTTKVSITALGGHRNEAMFVLTGLDIDAKERLVVDSLRHLASDPGVDELRFERIGNVTADPSTEQEASCFLRIAIRGDEEAVGRSFFGSLVELALASYPGLHMAGSNPRVASSYGVYWPAVVPQRHLAHRVVVGDARVEIPLPPMAADSVRTEPEPPSPATVSGPTESRPLGLCFDARSGDKGGDANVGLWAQTDDAYRWLEQFLTADALRRIIPDAAELHIERHPLPNLRAVNFVVHGLLDGGATETLRLDAQAKALGEFVRSRHVDLPRQLLTPST